MAFYEFTDVPVHDFVQSHKDEDALWLFLHIPKTAGSSFSVALSEQRAPYKNIHIDYENEDAPYWERMERAVDSFIAEAKETEFRSASGHFSFDLAMRIKDELPNVKLLTFLRDPLKRLVSDYRYQRTPMHPPYKAFIERFPTFEDYLEQEDTHNRCAQYLSSEELDVLTQRLDQDFEFVGLQEMFPMSYNIMFELFGLPGRSPGAPVRKTQDTQANKVEISEETKREIYRKNDLDAALFRHVREKLVTKRDEWRDTMETARAV